MRAGRLSRRSALGFSVLSLVALLTACTPADPLDFRGLADAPTRLSQWGLFEDAASQTPAERVVPYDLISPLFSDYALKFRFVRLPETAKVRYSELETFDFPVGTVIAKTFAYPADLRSPGEDLQLLETRLLVHRKSGWFGLPYVWNDEQTDAVLKVAGVRIATAWVDETGAEKRHDYLVPNANQCKGCHKVEEDSMQPIGPKARYLNHEFDYPSGRTNQLTHWSSLGILEGAPPPEQAPRVPVWDDPATGSLEERARTYLEINCAHCHNPGGPGRTTGLDLTWGERSDKDLGIFKFPVAAGRGSGDLRYGIVPGKPDESILFYRMTSLDPGEMMPELGRRLVHDEGVELLGQWIEAMEPSEPAAGS